MEKWTEGGVALPSRKDVPIPAGQGRARQGQPSTRGPAPGFMPGYVDVQKAFQDAFTAQIQGKTYDAGPVVAATKAAIDEGPGPVASRLSTAGPVVRPAPLRIASQEEPGWPP